MNFVMLSGVPRSGSQVLASMLNQHPMIYASTTSPVSELIDLVNNNWQNISAPLLHQDPMQYPNIVHGIITGAYKHVTQPVVIDKNRIWPRHGLLLTHAFGRKPKVICTVRNIPSIIASYILLIEKNKSVTFIDRDLMELKLPINMKNRCKIIWEKYIHAPYTSLRYGYNSNQLDILQLSYDDIVMDSQMTMDRICEFISIDKHTVRLNELQPMDENDAYHGGMDGLHTVRKEMRKTSPSAEQVIGKELADYYASMKLEFWK